MDKTIKKLIKDKSTPEHVDIAISQVREEMLESMADGNVELTRELAEEKTFLQILKVKLQQLFN